MSGKPRNRRSNEATSFQTAGEHRTALRATVSYLLLEQRMVFDGAAHDTAQATADPAAPHALPGAAHAPAGGPAPATDNVATSDHSTEPAAQDHLTHAPAPVPNTPEAIKLFGNQHTVDQTGPNSIVFIDASVRDASMLVQNAAPGVTVVMLDPSRDGLQEIADYVQGHSNIDSLHIVSHGDSGELRLGNAFYNNANIEDFSATLSAIGSALSRDGDILLYGCDTANGAAGERFITSISAMTGADIAASTNLTGRAADGGDWQLEFASGLIESDLAITRSGQESYGYLLNTTVSYGNGAMLVSAGNALYSVDALTGKATLIATAPATIGGVSFGGPINSIAVDHTNSLIYYVDSTINTNNRALFAFDYASNTHILIDSDLTNNGAGLSITVGNAGVGGGGAAFASGTLYLGVENTSGTDDTIYRITFSSNGRTITGANTLVASITGANDWGDLSVDAVNNALLSFSSTTLTRYNLSTGAVLSTATMTTSGQSGTDINGNFYVIGTTVQQINPTTGVSIGTGVTITTNGTTALANVSDATRWVPQTGSIGDLIFNDKDSDGVLDADEGGLANVTVQLIDDLNNNGVVDAGERVLATDTTTSSGYLFTGVLPGNYIVRVTDANGVLGGSSPTTGTATRQVGIGTIAGNTLTADFGYNRIAPIVDLNSTPTAANPVVNGTFTGNTSNWTLTGSSTFSSSVGSGGAVYWNQDASTGTLTQVGLTNLNSGPAPSGAAQMIFGFGWNNSLLDLGVPATLTISVGGTIYATVTTPTGAGPATIEYQNGASGSPASIVGSTSLAWTYTDILINLPSTVAASGSLVMTYNTALLGGDDISIDNVRINTYADTAAGRDWTAAYTENGTPVAIAGTSSGIVDPDNTNMASATIVLTNRQANDQLRIGGVAGTILANGSSGTINGIAYTVIDNGTTITVQLSGSATRAIYSDTIRSIVYENTGDAPSTTARVFNVTVSDGSQSSNTAISTISVTAVNDAPVNTLPGTYSFAEDGTLGLTGIQISDADAASGTMTVTLSVPSGALTATSGSGVSVTGSGTGSMTLTGTLTALNAYLSSASRPGFVPVANFNGAVTLTMTTSDGGNTGTGGTLTDTDTSTITVTAVNDAPINTLPATYSVAEDGTLGLTGLVISDVDAGSGTMTVTLSVTSGALTATSGSGVTITGSGTATLALSGTLTSINAYLASAARPNFVPTADFNGTVTLTMTTSDGGNTGSGGTLTDSDTSTITVTAVADAINDSVSATEDTAATFNVLTNDTFSNASRQITSINGTAIAVNGTVAVTGGTIRLNADGTLGFTPTANYNGSFSFTYTVTSNGTTETATVSVAVAAVNDAPVNTLPATYSVAEDGTLALTGLLISDVDAGSGTMTVTLSVPGGTLTATSSGGVTVAGSGTGTLALSGTLTSINAYLAGASRPNFVPTADFNGTVILTMTTSDGGNTGAGGTLTDTDTSTITVTAAADAVNDSVTATEDTATIFNVLANDSFSNPLRQISAINGTAIAVNGTVAVTGGTLRLNTDGTLSYTPTADYNGNFSFTYTVTSGSVTETATVNVAVAAVNDAPTQTLPGTQATSEDTVRVIAGVSVADVDSSSLVITLTSTNGTIAVTPGGGAVIVGNGTGLITITGSAAQINAALAGLTYTPLADFNGSASIAVSTTDGALIANGVISVPVTPVSDIASDSVSTNEDTAGTFNVLANDTFSNPSRVITAINGTAIAVNGSVAVSNGSVRLNGDGTLTFTPVANYNGSLSFTYTVTSGGVTETATVSVTVNPVNDAPAGADRTISIVEDNSYTFTAADFGFTDPNDTPANTLESVIITTLPTAGTLTLNGAAVTQGQVIAAASIPNLRWTPPLNGNGTGLASFTFQVRDTGGTAIGGQNTDQSPNTITFDVSAVNDAPVNTLPASYAINEDTSLALTGISIVDVDAAGGLFTATLSINTGGTLAATSSGGVTITGSGTTSITLSGTLANINAYLAASAPVFNPATDFNGPVTLTIVSNDNGGTGAGGPQADTDTRTIQVTAVNDAPVGANTSIIAAEDTAFSGTLPVATDVDSAILTYGPGTTAPANGSVTINANGTFTYTPAANYNGPDSFTYTVSDGQIAVEYTVTVTVGAINDAPVANPVLATTNEDTTLSVTAANGVLAFATDPDGDLLSVSSFSINGTSYTAGQVATGVWGSLVLNANGSYTYVPAANYNGAVPTITYTVTDGSASTSSTLTINVTPVNDAPGSTPIAAQTASDSQAVSFDISGNFFDVDQGDTRTYAATGLPPGLALNSTTGVISGTVDRSASTGGPYTVTITATDTGGLSANRSFVWTITNPAPTARNDAIATTENASVSGSVFADNGSGADSDPDGDPLIVSAVNGNGAGVGAPVAGSFGGTFVIAANGNYSFDPGTAFDNLAAGQTRSTSVTYTISDGQGGFSTATVTVTVTGQNDAPVANNDTFTTAEDAPVTFDPRINDSDIDGNSLTITQINGTAISVGNPVAITGGTVSLNANGSLTYTPTANFNGAPSFTYTISDGTTAATATVNGTVTPVNDAPVARNDSIATTENAAVSGSVFADNGNGADSDIDGDPLIVSAVNGIGAAVGTPVTGSGGGTFVIGTNGTYSFNPGTAFDNLAAGQTRTTNVTYTISDGQGGTSTATVTVTVTGQNDAPVALNDTFLTAEDTPVTFDPRINDSDIDGNSLTITQINGTAISTGASVSVTGGAVALNANGSLTFTPTANFNGAPSFNYTISDGTTTTTATVNGTVTPVNDAPTAADDGFVTSEDMPVTFDPRLNDTDIDGNALTITQINGVNIASGASVTVQGGTVTLNANGTLTFAPVTNFTGPVTFNYTISDGAGGVATATVSGNVTAVNDPPVAIDDVVILQEDVTATFDVRSNDSDVEGNPLTIVAINATPVTVGVPLAVNEGTITLNANGTLTFVPAANFNGQTTFTYTISDGQGGTATATVAVTVEGDNDAPVAANGSLTTSEDTAFSGNLPTATDADNDTVTYSAGATVPANGSVVVNANGSYTYTPAANFNGMDSFSFVVSDPFGGRNEYTVSVTVTAVNDAPTAGTIPSLSQIEAATVNMPVASYFTDLDGDTLAFSQTGLPAGLALDPVTGVISGVIANNASQGGPNSNGVYSVTIAASDGHGGIVSTTFTLTITNPAPVANNDMVSTTEDTPAVFNVITGVGTISGSAGTDTDPDGDTLQLISATASHGAVTLLANGSITYTPDANFNGIDTIVYTISDGQGGTASASVTVSVAAANDAPTASPIVDRTVNDGSTVSFNTGSFFSDVDGDNLSFTITGLPPGLAFDPATGLISGRIMADASGPTGSATYTVTITASDGNGVNASTSFTYTVLNLPPEANNDTATTAEDTPVDIPILANDTDPDGDTDEVIRVNNIVLTVGGPPVLTAHGQVALVVVGSAEVLRYTPNANYTGQESFTYTIDDRNSGVDTATVTVTVTPVNDAPVVMPIPNQSRSDGQSLFYNVASFFSDADGDTLSYSVSGLPDGLSFNPNTGLISGTIAANASQGGPGVNGVYAVTVSAQDSSGATVQTTFTVTITNPAPIATNDAVTIEEDESVEISPLLNDSDPDDDTLIITQASAAHGTVSIVNGVLNYTPNANFNGSDTISYAISDGNGGTSSAIVTVTINPVNDAPASRPIATLIDSDGQTVSFNTSTYFSDVDGDQLTFTITGIPAGLVYDTQTGVISGDLADDASVNGPYTVVVTASDGNGGASQQSFTWIVRNVSPSANDDPVSVAANATASGNVLGNDADPDGDPIFVAAVAGVPGNVGVAVPGSQGGTFIINGDGNFTFNPGSDFDDLPADATRVTTITYQVSDGEGDEDTANIVVTVIGVNDAPTAGTLPDRIRSDGSTVDYSIAEFFSDADGDDIDFAITGLPPGLTYSSETGRITGTLISNASQGGPNADGIYVVTVTARDGNGGEIDRTYRVIVSNPAPHAVNDTASTSEDVAIDIPVLANDTDPDGDTVSIDATFPPMAGHGTVAINADGTLRYTPNANYNGTDTIIYRITDGQGGVSTALVTITVTAVNDNPVAAPLPDTSLNDGDVVNLNVSGNFSDPEGGGLTYAVTGLPDGLTYDPATGVISGTIVASASGPTGRQDYLVTVTATDAQGGATSVQFTYTIVNLVPQAQGDTVAVTEDIPLLIDVLANDIDPDGDAFSIINVNGTSLTVGSPALPITNGTIALVIDAGRQKLLFTPSSNYNGPASFTYTIDDGNGGTSSATVTVNIGAANDAPTASTIPDRSDLDGRTVNLNVAGYFNDVDGDALVFSQSGLPAGLSLNATTGQITGTIASNASQGGVNGDGVYAVTITASDSQGGSFSTAFSFTIANPAPTAGNDTVLTTEDTLATFNVITGIGTQSGTTGADSDPDGDTLQLISMTAGNGAVSFAPDGSVTYTPNANFNGSDTLVYTISDGQGGTATATVTVVVTPVNDAPVIDLDTASAGIGYSTVFTEGGGPVAIAASTSFIADIENDIVALNISIAGIGSNGAGELIHIDGNTPLTFGTASVGTVTFGGVTLAYSYDGAGQLQFVNAAGSTQTIPATSLTALVRAIAYENRSYNPTSGTRSFTFVATDSDGNASATATAFVSIAGVNTAPVAANDSAITGENTTTGSAAPGVLSNDSDPEGDLLSVVAVAGSSGNVGVAVTGSNGGSFTLFADGSYSFDPGNAFDSLQIGQQRVTSIAYTISDGQGGTAVATLSVTVNGANDAPTGENASFTTNEDIAFSGTLPAATDVDGDALTYVLAAGPINGALTLNANGSYVYTPNANYNGADSFTYTVSDGRTTSAVYTITIGVTPVEDGPVAQPLPDIALVDGQAANLNVASAFGDPDNDSLSFSATGLPSGLVISSGGVISGNVDRSASQIGNGRYSITVTADDGNSNTVSETFTLTVTNPAPVASEDTAITTQNASTGGNVLANDIDPDSDPLTVVSVGGSAAGVGISVAGSTGGRFTIVADGTYSFDPGADFRNLEAGQSRETTVSYVVSDAQGGTSTALLRVTVTGINDAPVAGSISLVTAEDTAIGGTIVATDPDGDVLTFVIASQPSNGSVALTSDGSFTYTPAANFNGSDTFGVVISDGHGGARTVTVAIAITAINDTPVGADTIISVAEDTPYSGTLPAATDPDGPALTYAIGSLAPAHGSVTIDASGNFVYTPDSDFNGTDSFTYTISDGIAPPQTYTITVQLLADNDAPTAANDAATTDENSSVTGNVTANDSDTDGDTLTVIGVGAPTGNVGTEIAGSAGGVFVISADGAFQFTPNGSFDSLQIGEQRQTSVSYTISDNRGGVATAVLTVTVTGTNDAPTAGTLASLVSQDAATVSYNASTAFSDVDNGSLSFTASGLPAGLSIDVGSGLLTGTIGNAASNGGPSGNGIYTVTVTATDAGGLFVSRTFTLTVSNPAPIAGSDSILTQEGTAITGASVVSNDADPDGDALTYALISGPTNGVLTFRADGTYDYVPVVNFNGSDGFIYQVSDGQGGVASATVSITVTPVNDAPIAVDDPSVFVIAENGDVTLSPLANDSDPDGTPLTIVAIDGQSISTGGTMQVTGGIVTLNSDGSLRFIAAGGFSGPVAFSYTISDGALQGTATISGTVQPVNDLPVNTLPASFASLEDQPLPLAGISVSDSDAGNGIISVTFNVSTGTLIAATAGNVAVTGSGSPTLVLQGTLADINAYLAGVTTPIYQPPANATGSVTLTMTTNDFGNSGAGGALLDTDTSTIVIAAVNDLPIVSAPPLSVVEDTPASGAVLASDPDGDTLTFLLTTPPANGTVVLSANGTYTYTPNPNFNGTDTFNVTVNDGYGGIAIVSVNVTIAAVNDAPVGSGTTITLTEDSSFAGPLPTAFDADGDAITYAVGQQAASGTVIVNPNGSFSYIPFANFSGNDNFTYTVSDGSLASTYTVLVTVTGVNDPPVANNDIATAVEDTPTIINVLANDSDSDGQSLALVSASASNGAITINADGTLTYTPNSNYFGPDTIIYTVADASGATATAAVTVTVIAANDAPVGSNISVSVNEDRSLNGILTAIDADGDVLTFALAMSASNGIVSIGPGGSYSYTPNPNFFGADSFSYRVTDGEVATVYTVTVNVSPVNDAPVASPAPLVVTENLQATGALNALDPDGDPLAYAIATPPAHGTVTVNPDGTYVFTPVSGFVGSDSFTVSVSDGQGAMTQVVVSISVVEVNDPPEGAGGVITLSEDSTFSGNLPPATDPEGATVTYALASAATNGTVTINPDGSYIYVPNANFSGSDNFTYSVSDGVNVRTYTIGVTITPVNDAPFANDDSITVPRDGAVVIPVLANDGDIDGNALTIISATATTGTVVINPNGTLTYTPPAGFTGVVAVSYTVSDSQGGQARAQVTVSVVAANDVYVPSSGPTRPPPQIETPDRSPLERIGAPFILDAIRDIADLGDVSSSLDPRLPILSMVNGIEQLDGLAGLSLQIGGPLPGYDLHRPFSLDRYLAHPALLNLTDRALPDTQGFILSMELLTQSADIDLVGGQLTTQSTLHDRVLTLQFSAVFEDADTQVVEFRILQADGKPRPGWLGQSGRDMVIGEPPIDLDEVRLKIVALLADGRSVERNIIVDLSTGEVRPAPQELGWIRPPLFQERFTAPVQFADAEIDALGEALL